MEQYWERMKEVTANFVQLGKSAAIHLPSPDDVEPFLVGAGATLVTIGLVYGIWRTLRRRKRRKFAKYKGENMSEAAREAAEKILVEDIITDGLFEAEFNGKITRERANYWMKRLAEGAQLHGLKAKKFTRLKDEIKARLEKKGAPVLLPDGNIPVKKKKIFGGLFGDKAAA